MSETPPFDLQAAHRYFSTECFNRSWDLIEKADRTPEEEEAMLALSHASAWHWSQRSDCTEEQRSVAAWQLARIYALLSQADMARRCARLSLKAAERGALDPFYSGYAYEALARAELLDGNRLAAAEHLAAARRCAESMTDPEDRRQLMDDLAAF